jgi:CubicO group peptidase (beta-lactamase class C family)
VVAGRDVLITTEGGRDLLDFDTTITAVRNITVQTGIETDVMIVGEGIEATDGAVSLKSYAETLVKAPLAFEPGSAYEYGFGITVAGRIAEIVSGKKFEDLLAERISQPLGMTDTTFHPGPAHRARIAQTYKMDEDSKQLVPGYNPFVTSDPSVTHMTEPAGGLFSTAADMARFYQMILNGGTWEGKRIISQKSIAEMTRPHQAGGKELSYGLCWFVNIENSRSAPMMPVGGYGHGGAFATHGFIDPVNKVVTVYMVQNVLVPNSSQPRDTFHRLLNEALGIPQPAPPKKASLSIPKKAPPAHLRGRLPQPIGPEPSIPTTP